MHFIIGGAYQGKLAFAAERYQLTQADIFHCDGPEIDFSRRCISGLEFFVRAHPGAVSYFMEHRMDWQDKVLICQDLSGGLVPMDAADRAWRQETGRLCQYLSREAEQVSRIFCGLEQRLK